MEAAPASRETAIDPSALHSMMDFPPITESAMTLATILVAVACRNASGSADMPVFSIEATEEQIALGEHYDLAESKAEDDGYEGPFVCFDSEEQPALRAAITTLDGTEPSSTPTSNARASIETILSHAQIDADDGKLALEALSSIRAECAIALSSLDTSSTAGTATAPFRACTEEELQLLANAMFDSGVAGLETLAESLEHCQSQSPVCYPNYITDSVGFAGRLIVLTASGGPTFGNIFTIEKSGETALYVGELTLQE